MKENRVLEIESIVKVVGQNIDRIIKEKNLKLREVAVDCDMDPENLRKYIKGRQIMGINVVVRISKVLKVEIDELFKGI